MEGGNTLHTGLNEQANGIDRVGTGHGSARLVIPGDGGGVLVGVAAGVAALLVALAHPQRVHHRVLGAHRRALHLIGRLRR